MAVSLPAQRSGETLRAYYRRLNTLRASLRAYLGELRDEAVQAGKDAGLPVKEIARRMDATVQWLYAERASGLEYDPTLLPKQRHNEDSLAYYVRLRELRDAIRAELPTLVVRAVDEARQESPKPTKTQIAAELGVTESYMSRQIRLSKQKPQRS